jgi:serpin B
MHMSTDLRRTLVPALDTSIPRRGFLALLALPAVAAVLQACGGDDTSPSQGSTPDPAAGLVRSDIALVSTTVDEATAATTALNAFGADAYPLLTGMAGDSNGNLVFSPASIAIALTMVRAGAVGPTGSEIDDVFHVEDPATIHRAMNALSRALEARSGTFEVDGETREVTLSIANSLWGQSGLAFEQPFLDTLASEYDAGLRITDFVADPEGSRSTINEWVSDETRDRIPNLLPEGSITTDTRLTLVNAVYLKAPWMTQFRQEATLDLPFTRPDGSTVEVPTMAARLTAPYAAGDGWQAVELGYVGGELAMVLVVPDAGNLATVEGSLADGILDQAISALNAVEVDLQLPRWDIETSAQLADLLTDLGMPTAFSDAADFSGISREATLAISAVVHQANITVDENGTEAAAATAVVVGATSAPEPTDVVELHIDRPFLFALRDTTTGAITFLGRIADPSATRG